MSVAAKDVAARALDDGESRALVIAFGVEIGGTPAITRGAVQQRQLERVPSVPRTLLQPWQDHADL